MTVGINVQIEGNTVLPIRLKDGRSSLLLRLNKGGCAGFLVTTRISVRPARSHLVLIDQALSLAVNERLARWLLAISLRLESSPFGVKASYGGNKMTFCACGHSMSLPWDATL